jgi:hypothetical protein
MEQKKQGSGKNKTLRRKNDILWKGMLEEVFDDLLRFVFPRADRIFEDNIDRLFDKTNTMGIIEQVKQMKLAEAEEKGWREGRKEALTKKATEVVRNLIAETNFSISKIADIAGVSEAFVNRIKASLK